MRIETPASGAVSADLAPTRGEGKERAFAGEDYAASMRRKPFHTAVAAPEVSTGMMRSSW